MKVELVLKANVGHFQMMELEAAWQNKHCPHLIDMILAIPQSFFNKHFIDTALQQFGQVNYKFK